MRVRGPGLASALLGLRRRLSHDPVWQSAQLLGLRELLQRLRGAAGERAASVRWRATLWPLPWFGALPLPWAGLIGVALKLKATNRGVLR